MLHLREIRNAKGMTQLEVALAAGIGSQAIWRYEHGKQTPSLAVALRIAGALGVSLEELLGPDEALSTTSNGSATRQITPTSLKVAS